MSSEIIIKICQNYEWGCLVWRALVINNRKLEKFQVHEPFPENMNRDGYKSFELENLWNYNKLSILKLIKNKLFHFLESFYSN